MANTVQLNYVSPEIKEGLARDFSAARLNFDKTLPLQWNCELFGVRTGLQHEKDLPLYSFDMKKAHVTNVGIGPVKKFVLNSTTNELLGTSEKVQDQVRRSSASELISKITHAKTKQVLAYARCKSS